MRIVKGKLGLKIVEASKEASALVVSQPEKSRVEVDASRKKFETAFRGRALPNPFADVFTLPPELADDLEQTFSALKPPKQDLYQALCEVDPKLAEEIGPADLALMDKMLKNV